MLPKVTSKWVWEQWKSKSQYWHNYNQKCCTKQSWRIGLGVLTKRTCLKILSRTQSEVNPLIQHLCHTLSLWRLRKERGCRWLWSRLWLRTFPAEGRRAFEWVEQQRLASKHGCFLAQSTCKPCVLLVVWKVCTHYFLIVLINLSSNWNLCRCWNCFTCNSFPSSGKQPDLIPRHSLMRTPERGGLRMWE